MCVCVGIEMDKMAMVFDNTFPTHPRGPDFTHNFCKLLSNLSSFDSNGGFRISKIGISGSLRLHKFAIVKI